MKSPIHSTLLFALFLLPAVAQAQAGPTVTCTPVTTWGQDGEVYERNNVRLGSGFKTGAECPAYVTDELRKRALAKGPGVYEDGLLCKAVAYVTNKCTVTAPPVVPIVNPPVTSMTPGIGKIPASGARINVGKNFEDLGRTAEVAQRSGDDSGDFRTRVDPSHFSFDDPLVYPGQPGKSHLHVFFGNTGTNANSTQESISGAGNSTARGGTANRSAYWVPAIIDTRTGDAVIPDPSDFYYKSGYRGVDRTKIVPMPQGLRMIAGDPKNQVDPGLWSSPYVWKCHNDGAVQSTQIITTCPVGDTLELSLGFPQCWDGKNLDSPDHKSHMAYANGGCPPSHPVAIPEVSFHVLWPIRVAGEARYWRLSSDIAGNPAGYTAHGDWWNGWKKDISDSWSINCVAAGRDCHSHLLGDGRTQN